MSDEDYAHKENAKICQFCKNLRQQRQEDDLKLLDLPHSSAISYILPGLSLSTINNTIAKMDSARHLLDCSCEKLNSRESFTSVCRGNNNQREFSPSSVDQSNNNVDNLIDLGEIVNSSLSFDNSGSIAQDKDELSPESPKLSYSNAATSEAAEGTASLSISIPSSQLSDDESQAFEELELENDIIGEITHTPGGNSKPNVNNLHKELLKPNQDSSAYLEDYLKLLTSRSQYSRMSQSEKQENDFGDISNIRRCSAPSVRSKNELKCNRQRNLSCSSGKNNRSLGSTYLDGYLGNLTEHAWIIYPTETNISNESGGGSQSTAATIEESNVASPLHRRLQFINPDKFFNTKLTRSSSNSTPPSAFSYIASDNEIQSARSRSNTMDSATSPDVSSSIFDKDTEGESHMKSVTIDSGIISQEINSCHIDDEDTMKETGSYFESSETCISLRSNSSEMSPTSSGVMSMSMEVSNSSCENTLASTITQNNYHLQAESTTSGTLKQDIILENEILCSQELEKNFEIYDKTNKTSTVKPSLKKADENHSSSSEASSVTEPSTIVLASEQMPHRVSDFEQSSVSSDTEKTVSRHLEGERFKCDANMIRSQSGMNLGEERTSNIDPAMILIKMLKSKHQKETEELKVRQREEMNQFCSQLKQFSFSELASLVESYRNAETVLQNAHESGSELSESIGFALSPKSVPKYNSDHSQHLASRQTPNIMPSFFLHENHENHDERKSVHQSGPEAISRLFAPKAIPCRSPKSVTELLKVHPDINRESEKQNQPHVTFRLPSPLETGPNYVKSKRCISFSDTLIDHQPVLCDRNYETGLDLFPSRERDLASLSTNYELLNPKALRGLCKFQAAVKGRRIRRLMKTKEIQKLLSTLTEVFKLAHEFHQDILKDNIKRGDIEFHKALFQEEQQARNKFWYLLVEANPSEQIKTIQTDKIIRDKNQSKRMSAHPPAVAAPAVKPHINAQQSTVRNKIVKKPTIKPPTKMKPATPTHCLKPSLLNRVCVESPPRLCRSMIAVTAKNRSPDPPRNLKRNAVSHIPLSKVTPVAKGVPQAHLTPVAVAKGVVFPSPKPTQITAMGAAVAKTVSQERAGKCRGTTKTTNVNGNTGVQWRSVGRSSSMPRKPWR